jgi:hypothetical protein
MRALAAAMMIGPLMVFGSLSAPAEQPPERRGAGVSIRVAAADDAATDRDSYAQAASAKVQEWQRKLQGLERTTEAAGKKAGDAADEDLNKAWTGTETAARELRIATAEGWENAKAAFEKASRELAEAWHRIRVGAK